jgi:tetratricopeptide (TPR) repeat protein
MRNYIKTALILVVGAVAAWYGFKTYGEGPVPGDVANVVTARVDIEPGDVIAEGMLETRVIPRRYMQQDAYEARMMTDVKIPAGLVAAVRIPKGDQLTKNCLKDTGRKPLLAVKITDKKSLSQERYVEGLKYFQSANYEKAREEWRAAVKLDPKNPDAASGLDRIKKITSR